MHEKEYNLMNLLKEIDEELEKQSASLEAEDLQLIREKIMLSLKQELQRIIKQKRGIEAAEVKLIPVRIEPVKEEKKYVERFSLNIRIQHLILMISVIILILTGLPLKFHETAWASFFFSLVGGINNSAFIHRIGASGLIIVGIYHLLYIAFFKEGWQNFKLLVPRIEDFKNFTAMILYYLGIRANKPEFDKFSYVEKFDYWAVYWGMVIMIGSGLLLWFHNISMTLFPKYVIDIAREAHSDEGLLATLAIIIWHFYNVHLNPSKFPFNKSMFTGKIPIEELKEEHFLEYKRLFSESFNSAVSDNEVEHKNKNEDNQQQRN